MASSKAIKDDDSDPPCIRAKWEYEAIIGRVNGSFKCVGEPESNPGIVEFEITRVGVRCNPAVKKTRGLKPHVAAPVVLVPPKSKEPTFPKMSPSRRPIKPWGGGRQEPPGPILPMNTKAKALLEQQVLDLQARHPSLRLLHDGRSGLFLVEGHIGFRGACNSRTVRDKYRVRLLVPRDYPQSPPVVFETGGKIPADYEHLMKAGNLCLGVPLEVDLRFASNRTLLHFVDDLVVPYLFGFSYSRRYGEMPFGEYCHGPEALLHSYQEYFHVAAPEATLLLCLLAAGSAQPPHLARHGTMLREVRAIRPPDRFKKEIRELRIWLARREYKTSQGEVIPRQFLSTRTARTTNRTSRRHRGKARHNRSSRRSQRIP